jgi:hypothetical protein
MIPIPNQLAAITGTLPAGALLLSLLAVSLLLAFAGRTIIKVIAFLVVGLVGAGVGVLLAAQYLAAWGTAGTLLGVLGGFVVGGLIGVLAVALGIGLAIGYAAYLLTTTLVSGTTIPLIVGFVFFIVGVALYNRILGLVTALAGGLLLFDVLTMYGLGPLPSMLFAALVAVAGLYVQESSGKKNVPPQAASPAGGQQSGPS